MHWCQIGNQFWSVNLDVGYNRRTRLGNDQLWILFLDVFQVGLNRQFGTETGIEHCFDTERFEPGIEVKILVRETCRNGRSNDGDHFHSSPQVGQEDIDIVDDLPSTVGTCTDACSASDTRVEIETDVPLLAGTVSFAAVIAKMHWASTNTLVTVDAFFFIDVNYGGEFFHVKFVKIERGHMPYPRTIITSGIAWEGRGWKSVNSVFGLPSPAYSCGAVSA